MATASDPRLIFRDKTNQETQCQSGSLFSEGQDGLAWRQLYDVFAPRKSTTLLRRSRSAHAWCSDPPENGNEVRDR